MSVLPPILLPVFPGGTQPSYADTSLHRLQACPPLAVNPGLTTLIEMNFDSHGKAFASAVAFQVIEYDGRTEPGLDQGCICANTCDRCRLTFINFAICKLGVRLEIREMPQTD